MKRIFLSDLHIEAVDSQTAERFSEVMETESQWADEIYILGDLVEMWIGDDDDSELAEFVRGVLKKTVAQTQLFLTHGNRDFLYGEAIAEATGVNVFTGVQTSADGIVLCHGDEYCIDDEAYQQMRALFRSEAWQADILSKTLAERAAFGAAIRAQSKQDNANKASNIMDVNDDAVAAAFADVRASIMIHGHTHRPGVHRVGSTTRIVLGAWERCGWLVRQTDSQLDLECFSLAHHYGSETPHQAG